MVVTCGTCGGPWHGADSDCPLKLNHYGVIYADPPWSFKTFSRKGLGRSAGAHYDCMSYTDICAIDVKQFAAKDCVLFLWTTDPMLPMAIHLLWTWGFTYKTTGFIWAKTRRHPQGLAIDAPGAWPINMGYWTRGNPEICLLATRGKPKRLSAAVRKLILAPRREHSRKPDEVYDRIEALCTGPYLELFARQTRPGWTAWGKEVESGIGSRRWKSSGECPECRHYLGKCGACGRPKPSIEEIRASADRAR